MLFGIYQHFGWPSLQHVLQNTLVLTVVYSRITFPVVVFL